MAIDIALQRQDTMPRGEGDLVLEGHGIEPIPETNRYGSAGRLFTVWFAPNLAPATFFLGTLAILPFIGLGFWSGFAAIVVGNVIGAALVGVLSVMGPRTGLAQIPLARFPFGKSIIVPAGINWLATIAWDAVNSIFGAGAVVVLTNGAVPFPGALVVVVILQAGLGVLGYEWIHTFEKYASVGLGILFVIVTVAALPKANFALADQAGVASLGSFVLMTTIVAGFVLGWAVYASDYSRYLVPATPPRTIFRNVFLGLVISCIWMETLGLVVAGALGATEAPMEQINGLVGGGLVGALAMVAVFFATVAVNALNDYSGSLSLLAAGVRVWRPISAVVVGVLAFFATLWLYYNNFAHSFESYLLLLTYWIGPWAAIVLVDWYLRRGEFEPNLVRHFAGLPSGRNALIALVVGFLVSVPFFDQEALFGFASQALGGADIAYLVGFVVAGALYWVIERASPTAAMAMEPMGSMGSMETMGSAESMAPMEPMPPTETMAPVDSMAPKPMAPMEPMAPMGGEEVPMEPTEPVEPKGEDSGM